MMYCSAGDKGFLHMAAIWKWTAVFFSLFFHMGMNKQLKVTAFFTFVHRPCAMVVPDFELICEIMLVAEGFLNARVLARKFITLYTLCKELLSKQVLLASFDVTQPMWLVKPRSIAIYKLSSWHKVLFIIAASDKGMTQRLHTRANLVTSRSSEVSHAYK